MGSNLIITFNHGLEQVNGFHSLMLMADGYFLCPKNDFLCFYGKFIQIHICFFWETIRQLLFQGELWAILTGKREFFTEILKD